MAGMAGMAERQKEWQNSRMAEMAIYVLFMVHTNDDTNDDDDTFTLASRGLEEPAHASRGLEEIQKSLSLSD